MKIVDLECPNCGARLSVVDGMYVCNSCGTTTAIDYDDSDVEYERLKTLAEQEEKQREHEKEMLERQFELQQQAQIEAEKRQSKRNRQAAARSIASIVIRRIIAYLVMAGFIYGGYRFFRYVREQNGSFFGRSGISATPTPAPDYNVTPENLKDKLDDFIVSGKTVQMKIDECAILNKNGVAKFYSKKDAVFLDAYLVSEIPDKDEEESNRLVLIYEVTWNNEEYGDKTCYDAVYFEGIRVNPKGGIISDYKGEVISRSDAAWGWSMAYSFEDYDQCYLENVKALGGTVSKVVINSSFGNAMAQTEATAAPPFDGSRISKIDLKGVKSKGMTFTVSSDYVAGRDLVINIKSKSAVKLGKVYKYNPNGVKDIAATVKQWKKSGGKGVSGVTMADITSNCTLVKADGVYALTISSDCLSTETNYYVEFSKGAGLIISCK